MVVPTRFRIDLAEVVSDRKNVFSPALLGDARCTFFSLNSGFPTREDTRSIHGPCDRGKEDATGQIIFGGCVSGLGLSGRS